MDRLILLTKDIWQFPRKQKKDLNSKKLFGQLQKKNPFKIESKTSVAERIKYCKKIIGINSFIKVKFYEKIIKSNKTINLINHLKKDKSIEIYFLMGADNLINFHKWHKSKLISQKCNILVFDRHGYKKNSLKSKTFKHLSKANLEFIEFDKVNISSSQLRKI